MNCLLFHYGEITVLNEFSYGMVLLMHLVDCDLTVPRL